ncbi:hypothetical protein CURTO8I2_120023 [Curtobacterium sp. 8I-2]|nr:hypothetical protein CURTO8I2_120023 [Curtobacterium sp. 8I-2]
MERRADAAALPVAQHVPVRHAAAHRLGPHPRPVLPQRPAAQAAEPAAARPGLPGHPLAPGRRRRATRREPLRRLLAGAPGQRRGRRHPAAVHERSGPGRWSFAGAGTLPRLLGAVGLRPGRRRALERARAHRHHRFRRLRTGLSDPSQRSRPGPPVADRGARPAGVRSVHEHRAGSTAHPAEPHRGPRPDRRHRDRCPGRPGRHDRLGLPAALRQLVHVRLAARHRGPRTLDPAPRRR